jgi:phosphoesterase RecJ-like protein
MTNKHLHNQIRERMQSALKIMILTHVRPDGDAIGSLLGLGMALQNAGKMVEMVSTDGLPANFRHLPGSPAVLTQPTGGSDLVITVDCSELERTGRALESGVQPDINIDHHVTNPGFAQLNLVDPTAVATAEIITEFLPDWGLSLSSEVAAALLTGMITDSLGFRTSNMTSKAMRLAAELMDAGADLPDLYMRGLVTRSFEAMRFWGSGLVKLERENGIVWVALSMADRQASGYPGRDDADLINALSAINGAEIAIIFVEQPNGCIKVSWRAHLGIDVTAVALKFGGGGHPSASGAELKGDLQTVQEQVLEETRKLLAPAEITG